MKSKPDTIGMAVKVIELVGTSPNSWQEAVQEAIDKTGKKIRNIHGVDVVHFKANVENGKISEYRAVVKIAFVVE